MDDPIPMPFCSYSEAVHKLADAVYEFVENNPEYEVYNVMNALFEQTIPDGYIFKVSKIVKICAEKIK